jgi:hypothetical protein
MSETGWEDNIEKYLKGILYKMVGIYIVREMFFV